MKGDYPRFQENYSHEELVEHFLFNETDREFIAQFRMDANRHGIAILLKSLQYLGYLPQHINEIPRQIKAFIAKQLSLVGNPSEQYLWQTRTRDNHFAWIRQQTGFRFPAAQYKADLESWLRSEGAPDAITFADLFECAIQRFRSLRIELPSEKELQRIVNAALNGFFSDVHQEMTHGLDRKSRKNIDGLLIVPAGEAFSPFEKLKASTGRPGVKNLQKEITKLQQMRSVGIVKEHLMNVPFKVQKLLKHRATNETASKMREHPEDIRYGLMACFISIRTMEVMDDIVRMFIEMIHRVNVRAEKKRDNELLRELKRVDGKTQILFRLAEAAMDNPDGTIRDVIFPVVKAETLQNLVSEKEANGPQYRRMHRRFMKEKYTRHYGRMLPLVLENLTFLCNYLSSIDLRREIQAALNVIENWNGTNDFIFYARRGRLMTNDQQDMEISVLSLHLLQNCLILINTLLLERTIEQRNMLEEMSPEDMRALTPLFYGHVNPYGLFELNLERASFLEVA